MFCFDNYINKKELLTFDEQQKHKLNSSQQMNS